jgi:competence protein ComEA
MDWQCRHDETRMAPEPSQNGIQKPSGRRSLLRRLDQAAVASLITLSLVAMGAYWFVQGGHRGELIEIDRAEPLTARYLVDINKAEWPELAELPDLGETLARRIVNSRAEAGPFGDHEDLLRVNGIGPRTLEKMKLFLLPMPDQEDVAGEVSAVPEG